jgi:hypothetical protein
MQFVNHTPFPAMAFLGVAPQNEEFHTVALRQSLTWDDTGTLSFADEQAPLCPVDERIEPTRPKALRQESDFSPYKPRCDVLVNAGAYPPKRGDRIPPRRFAVNLSVRGPDIPMPIPPEPQGLNQFMAPPPERMAIWRAAVERAKGRYQPGKPLIGKTLRIIDERHPAPLPFLGALIGLVTLGVARPFRRRADEAAVAVSKLGIRPLGHRDRTRFAGKADADFAKSGALFPPGFDFAIWNAAWPDQQVEELAGDEVIELMNLCPPDTPALWRDGNGNGFVRLALPPWRPCVLVRYEAGPLVPAPLRIDTLIIEPERRTISLVFRCIVMSKPKVRCMEVRQVTRAEWQALVAAIQTAAAARQASGDRHG